MNTNLSPTEQLALNYLDKAHRMLQKWYGQQVRPADPSVVKALAKKMDTVFPWWVVQSAGSYLSRRGPKGGIEITTVQNYVDLIGKVVAEAQRAVEEAPEAWFPLQEKHLDPLYPNAPKWPKWFNVAPF